MEIVERTFFKRPRILNQLHRLGLASATTQTNEMELRKIEQYAAGRSNALEIGSYQGVSAARIAAVLASTGVLYCVDPWPEVGARQNPCWQICERHLRRSHVRSRIQIIRGYSGQMEGQIPDKLDFAFIDGDHTWTGISTDWQIVAPRIVLGGIVCLHDTIVPPSEPWKTFDSIRYFQEVIAKDTRFVLCDKQDSLSVLRKIHTTA